MQMNGEMWSYLFSLAIEFLDTFFAFFEITGDILGLMAPL